MAFAVENPAGGGNTPQYTPEGLARLDAFTSQYRSIPETGAWCLGTGMPGVMMSLVTYPIQIVQTPELIVMLAELEMQLRRIHLEAIRTNGYSFLIELKFRALRAGFTVREIPIIFVDRRRGTSKITRREIYASIATVWKLRLGFYRE